MLTISIFSRNEGNKSGRFKWSPSLKVHRPLNPCWTQQAVQFAGQGYSKIRSSYSLCLIRNASPILLRFLDEKFNVTPELDDSRAYSFYS